MQLEHRTLHLSRLALHVVMTGSGSRVVLLHGWPQTWHEWRKVMPLLAGQHRLVVLDLPGLGESGRPDGGYAKKTLALDLREMCDRLQLGRFHLVGHDWGGPTAFTLACAAPAAVATLTMLDARCRASGRTSRKATSAGTTAST
jgi:pimeloyl-ACP methyl ester carboxylesterase